MTGRAIIPDTWAKNAITSNRRLTLCYFFAGAKSQKGRIGLHSSSFTREGSRKSGSLLCPFDFKPLRINNIMQVPYCKFARPILHIPTISICYNDLLDAAQTGGINPLSQGLTVETA